MKLKLLLLALLIASPCAAAGPQAAQTQAPSPAADDYSAFVAQMVSPENLAECIGQMDKLIDAGDGSAETPKGGPVAVDTKNGFHLEFSVMGSKQFVMYYLVFSREGRELKFSDAAKMIALFGDRAGLPHPIIITEGEKPVFYAQWLIKPSEWKEMRRMILKVRTENRAEKDPQKAFATAVIRELKARQAAQRQAESL